MMNNLLFDVDKKLPPENRCRNCIHMTEHYYNSRLKYCNISQSNRTSNGLKKIKANDAACPGFERKMKTD